VVPQCLCERISARLDNLTGEMVYFSRGLGIAPGVGDVLAESHLSSNGSLKYTYVYVQNHRGDTIALVSNSTVVARYEYSAWGNVVSHTGADAWLTFSGKHYDSDAGLYYYGYRWYDPQAKRWTQPDPTGLAEGLDLYRFCGNDPVNGVDVYGLDSWWNPLDSIWNAGKWSARQIGNGAKYTGQAAVSTYDYVFDDRCLFLGWITGPMGEMLSGTKNMVSGCPSLCLSQWGSGIYDMGRNVFCDVGALVYGMGVRKPYTIGKALWDSRLVFYDNGPSSYTVSRQLITTLLIPNYGTHGGPYSGSDQESDTEILLPYDQASVFPDDNDTWAARNHDLKSDERSPYFHLYDGRRGQIHFEFVRDSWTGPRREPGPYGQAYRLLGTAFFPVFGLAELHSP